MQRTPITKPKPDRQRVATPVQNHDFINNRARRRAQQQNIDTDERLQTITDLEQSSKEEEASNKASSETLEPQRATEILPQALYKTPERLFDPLSDFARSIRKFAANLNFQLRPTQSQVVIEDLNTNEIFVSPRASLSPFSNITERKRGENPILFNKTIKIESPELLKKLRESQFSENPTFNPTYTFPLKSSTQKRKLSNLQALTFPHKQSTSETKIVTPTISKRSLNFYYEGERSPQSFSENESNSEEEHTPKMAFELGDILKTIPPFDGKEKDLDTFINICESFYDVADEDMRERLPGIFKMKIIGRALARIQPTSELDTWARIKTKLESTFKKPITYELAQYEMAMIKQKRNESIEEYAERILNGLEKLNNAAKSLVKDESALPHLIMVNSRQALQHFEQNIYSDELRVRVDSANKGSLSESILFAKQKEISLKLNTAKTCEFCKMTGHEVADCRKKNSNQPQPSTSGQGYRNYNNQNYGNQNPNRFSPTGFRNNGRGNYNNNNNNYNNGNRFNNNNSNPRFNNNNGNNRYGNNGNNNYNTNRYGNNNFNNNGNPYGNNRNNNFSNNGYGNSNYGNNNYGNNSRNDTYYRDSRMQNNGNGNNNSNNNRNIPQEQRGYFRNNNPNNNNTGNNSEGNNQRTNFDTNNSRNNGGNTRPNPSTVNRGNIRSMQGADEQPNFEYNQQTVTAQIHEKN